MARATSDVARFCNCSNHRVYRSLSRNSRRFLKNDKAFASRIKTSLNSGARGSMTLNEEATTDREAPSFVDKPLGSKGIPRSSATPSISVKGAKVVFNASTVACNVCCCSNKFSQFIMRLLVRPVTSSYKEATSPNVCKILSSSAKNVRLGKWYEFYDVVD